MCSKRYKSGQYSSGFFICPLYLLAWSWQIWGSLHMDPARLTTSTFAKVSFPLTFALANTQLVKPASSKHVFFYLWRCFLWSLFGHETKIADLWPRRGRSRAPCACSAACFRRTSCPCNWLAIPALKSQCQVWCSVLRQQYWPLLLESNFKIYLLTVIVILQYRKQHFDMRSKEDSHSSLQTTKWWFKCNAMTWQMDCHRTSRLRPNKENTI